MGRPGVAHDFVSDLARSHRVEDELWWPSLYRRQWPDLVGIDSLRHDRDMQRAGCDRRLTLEGGAVVLVEEKVRHARGDGSVFEDVLVEVRSDVEKGTPGWILKRAARCDWLIYVNLPGGWALLLPWPALRAAYEANKWEWARRFGSVDSPNETGGRVWVTRSIPVPLSVMQAAVPDSLLIRPLELDEATSEEAARAVAAEVRCEQCALPDHRAAGPLVVFRRRSRLRLPPTRRGVLRLPVLIRDRPDHPGL